MPHSLCLRMSNTHMNGICVESLKIQDRSACLLSQGYIPSSHFSLELHTPTFNCLLAISLQQSQTAQRLTYHLPSYFFFHILLFILINSPNTHRFQSSTLAGVNGSCFSLSFHVQSSCSTSHTLFKSSTQPRTHDVYSHLGHGLAPNCSPPLSLLSSKTFSTMQPDWSIQIYLNRNDIFHLIESEGACQCESNRFLWIMSV